MHTNFVVSKKYFLNKFLRARITGICPIRGMSKKFQFMVAHCMFSERRKSLEGLSTFTSKAFFSPDQMKNNKFLIFSFALCFLTHDFSFYGKPHLSLMKRLEDNENIHKVRLCTFGSDTAYEKLF